MGYLQDTLPTPEEAAIAKLSSRDLAAFLETKSDMQSLNISDKEGHACGIDIPVSALRLLVDVLTQLGEGNAVNLIPIHAQLTTQEGADMLNISRPTFIKLLDEHKIPHYRKGNRRKVALSDVLKYKQDIDTKRLKTLENLSKLDQAMNMGYE